MRLISLGAGIVVGLLASVVVATNVFKPPAAATRLAGVSVAVIGYTVNDLDDRRHRLNLTVAINSARDLDECMGFTLDAPFAGRRLDSLSGRCVRPVAGRQTVQLMFDGLTEDDVTFPSHTVVWGVPGGRCGPILGLFGVCVVDQAGTAELKLPSRSTLPTFRPLGSFLPLFSFPAP
jgi:xanthosine utilization system XapX-like protein